MIVEQALDLKERLFVALLFRAFNVADLGGQKSYDMQHRQVRRSCIAAIDWLANVSLGPEAPFSHHMPNSPRIPLIGPWFIPQQTFALS